MEIFLEGFQRLQKDGKVRAYGLSTSDFDYIKDFNADGKCASLQIDYSILNRTPESDILGYCKQNGIGVIVRGALAMGLLTGKFDESTVFHETDFRRKWQTDPEQNAVYKRDLAKVKELAPLARGGRTLAQAALQFTLEHDAVTTVIPGAKNARQVQANLPGMPFSPEERALIERVTPRGGGRKIWPA